MRADFEDVRIRPMTAADVERVMEIASSLKDAPQWMAPAYRAAMDREGAPRRIALVAENLAGIGQISNEMQERRTSGAKAPADSAGVGVGVKTPTYQEDGVGAKAPADSAGVGVGVKTPTYQEDGVGAKAHVDFAAFSARLKPPQRPRPVAGDPGKSCPDTEHVRSRVFTQPFKTPTYQDDGKRVGRIVGFAVASVLSPEAELETIAVVAEGQRRGVARRLWAAMATELRAAGAAVVHLEVRASNGAALGFYRAQGFVENGRRPRYYADPEEDAILLGIRLA